MNAFSIASGARVPHTPLSIKWGIGNCREFGSSHATSENLFVCWSPSWRRVTPSGIAHLYA